MSQIKCTLTLNNERLIVGFPDFPSKLISKWAVCCRKTLKDTTEIAYLDNVISFWFLVKFYSFLLLQPPQIF